MKNNNNRRRLYFLFLLAVALTAAEARREGEEKEPVSTSPPLFVDEEDAKTFLYEMPEDDKEKPKKVEYKCFARAFEMGPQCNSSEELDGDSPHTKVDYHISIKDDKSTGVFCYGLGMGYCIAPVRCGWGYHFLGLITTGTASVIWGEHKDYPSIKCTAIPKAAGLRWSWDKGFCNNVCSDDAPSE